MCVKHNVYSTNSRNSKQIRICFPGISVPGNPGWLWNGNTEKVPVSPHKMCGHLFCGMPNIYREGEPGQSESVRFQFVRTGGKQKLTSWIVSYGGGTWQLPRALENKADREESKSETGKKKDQVLILNSYIKQCLKSTVPLNF